MIMLAHRDDIAAISLTGAEIEGLMAAAGEVAHLELLSRRAAELAPDAEAVRADLIDVIDLTGGIRDRAEARRRGPVGLFRSLPPQGLRPVDEEVGRLLAAYAPRMPAWHREKAVLAWDVGSRTLPIVLMAHGLAAAGAQLPVEEEGRLQELVGGATGRGGDLAAVRACRAGLPEAERQELLRRVPELSVPGRRLMLLDCVDGHPHVLVARSELALLVDLVDLATEAVDADCDRFRFDYRERLHELRPALARIARELDEGPLRAGLRRLGAWR